jgi:hypothetical protein
MKASSCPTQVGLLFSLPFLVSRHSDRTLINTAAFFMFMTRSLTERLSDADLSYQEYVRRGAGTLPVQERVSYDRGGTVNLDALASLEDRSETASYTPAPNSVRQAYGAPATSEETAEVKRDTLYDGTIGVGDIYMVYSASPYSTTSNVTGEAHYQAASGDPLSSIDSEILRNYMIREDDATARAAALQTHTPLPVLRGGNWLQTEGNGQSPLSNKLTLTYSTTAGADIQPSDRVQPERNAFYASTVRHKQQQEQDMVAPLVPLYMQDGRQEADLRIIEPPNMHIEDLTAKLQLSDLVNCR